MKNRIKTIFFTALIVLIIACAGCSNGAQDETPSAGTAAPVTAEPVTASPETEVPSGSEAPDSTGNDDMSMEIVPLTEKPAMFELLLPAAAGTDVLGNEKAAIDVSNKEDGYIMVRFLEETTKDLRVILTGASGTSYTYVLNSDGDYEVYPLSDGNGGYGITVYEGIGGGKYSIAFSDSFDVELADEFAPFLRPNQYVNYDADSETLKKAAELTADANTVLEKIAAIYDYVINNITYDKELAASVQSGYLPDIDAVLETGKGICFDYAAVMTAMLRSQGIPTKLVVGYTGDAYHSWINAYSEETGWVDSVVYFDGTSWMLMDPTYASTGGQTDEVLEYIGNGENYTAKYLY